jgi:PEP-CTERM/exosortase A-associated glycosyltransferase
VSEQHRPLRVLHVFHHIFHYPCGYRTRSENIVRHQRTIGIEPIVVTSCDHEGLRQLPDPDGIRVRRSPTTTAMLPGGMREFHLMSLLLRVVSRAIEVEQPDVVHAHSPVLVALPAFLAARRHERPFVYEIRDLWENASVDMGKFPSGSWRYRAARRADTYVLRRADAVTVICQTMRAEIAARLRASERVFVAPNGVCVEALRHDLPESGRRRWGLWDGPVIGYVGTLQPYEGVELLIAAMPSILQSVPDAHLLIVGDGNHEASLRAEASRRGLAAHVTFAGRISHSEVSCAYAACDLLVYPRRLTETTRLTTPLKPLEPMALGKAVLASDVAAMRELVEPGVTGRLFRAGHAAALARECVQLLQQPRLRERLGRAARDWALRERQWSAVVAEYQNVYSAVTNRPIAARLPLPSSAALT